MTPLKTKEDFKQLRKELSDIVREHDPICLIELGCPSDEYDPEVGTILPRLKEAECAEDMKRIVYEEFCHWFGESTTGPRSAYEQLGEAVWELADKYLRDNRR